MYVIKFVLKANKFSEKFNKIQMVEIQRKKINKN